MVLDVECQLIDVARVAEVLPLDTVDLPHGVLHLLDAKLVLGTEDQEQGMPTLVDEFERERVAELRLVETTAVVVDEIALLFVCRPSGRDPAPVGVAEYAVAGFEVFELGEAHEELCLQGDEHL